MFTSSVLSTGASSPIVYISLMLHNVSSLRSLLLKNKLRGLSPRAKYTDLATSLVGEINGNFCRKSVPRGQSDGSLRPYSRFCRPCSLLVQVILIIPLHVVLFFLSMLYFRNHFLICFSFLPSYVHLIRFSFLITFFLSISSQLEISPSPILVPPHSLLLASVISLSV
jgi:hypothetical protein